MARGVRFIIFNRDEALAKELRARLLSLEGAKIIAEVDEPAMLAQTVRQCPVDVLLVNLDPDTEAILPIAGEIAQAEPRVAVFAASSSTDGQLILRAMRMGAPRVPPPNPSICTRCPKPSNA